jgi:GcrA cell cycle regulator
MVLSYLIGRRNAQNSPWTQERDALLVRLWTEGHSASQIAAKLRWDVSRCAVIARAHRLNLAPRKPRHVAVPKPPPPRPVPPPPPSTSKAKANAPGMRRLRFIELKPSNCRFPIEEMGFFCGADAESGRVYCPFHQRMSRVRA